MTDIPKISVVLPVFNGGDYLAEAVQSILGQTFTDFELLVADDGSSDCSLQVMREFEKLDSRVRLHSRENRGLVSTLNELVQMANGIWIARMDADDVARPERLERQLAWLQQTGADVCGSWVRRFGSGDNRLVKLRQTDNAIKTELLFHSPFAHPSVMFRASLAKQLPYDDTWIKAEDYDLWVRAAEAGWMMGNVPEDLLLYRVHQEQVSAQAGEFQQIQGHKIRRRYWACRFAHLGLDPEELDAGLKIFSAPASEIDMNAVDRLFGRVIAASDAEAGEIIFSHLSRLYRLAAADSPGVVARWGRLNRRYGRGLGLGTKLQLGLLRSLRIRQDSGLARWFKRLYRWGKTN